MFCCEESFNNFIIYIDNYDAARRKLSQAELTSNLESDEEECQTKCAILSSSNQGDVDWVKGDEKGTSVLKEKSKSKKFPPSIRLPAPPAISSPEFGLQLAEGSGTRVMEMTGENVKYFFLI